MRAGVKIAQAREALNITQSELAQDLGVTRVTLNRWEKGDASGLKGKYIVALEKTLQMEPGELFKALYKTEHDSETQDRLLTDD